MCRSARQTLGLVLSLGLLFTSAGSRAQETQHSEYEVKAAFLFNFAKFIEWPPEAFATATSPFIIGVLGENPFGSELEGTIRNKKINDRPFVIQEFRSPAEATNCHILFISASGKKRLPEILSGLSGTRALTVSEQEGFIAAGGMINFVLVQENKKLRVCFQINEVAAKNANLRVSSKLLSLALPPAK